MTQHEASTMATELLRAYGDRGFEISLPDKEAYDLMRQTFRNLGRDAGPDGEFLILKVGASTAVTVPESE